MRHPDTQRLVGIALGLLVALATNTMAEDETPFPEEARKRLDYAIGKWRSKSERLDREGNVVKTSVTTDERRFVVGDRVVEITGFDEDNEPVFRAWEYYDVQNDKYTLASIGGTGKLTVLSGDLGDAFTWAGTVERQNGGSMIMRFTHSDIAENSFTALGEYSIDGGNTWTAFSRQYLTRIGK